MTSKDPRDYAHEHALGGMWRQAYEDDPKRLCFTLARYKHVAKMLQGFGHVLEVGCADGFGSRIVRQHVDRLTAFDSDSQSIEEARRGMSTTWPIDFKCLSATDLLDIHSRDGYCASDGYDAVYTLDVLEHISPDGQFLRALAHAAPVAIIGMPSKESQQYASEMSRLGHVNCYSAEGLKARLRSYWDHVFLFTMHDETLGTSYGPMAHYLLALCVQGRRS